ncbi:MAG: ABC transporter ATP-binding protein [Acidobacteria bacterium]|nr:ABC transporter ATP-binding protein [Acidobacteriota bacterium]
MSSILKSEQLTMRFRRLTALDHVDLEVPEGAVFALTGPNGAGKTTTLECAMNMLRPTSGRCEVLGKDSRRLGPRELEQIGFVSEGQKLPSGMTVARFLAFCQPMYPAWSDADAAALVKQFGLPLDRKLSALSRGQRVKAMLTAALAHRPKLILLDEPFGGLDVLVREQLIRSVLDRTPEATVVLASHDMAEIESFATHIAYLEEGRLRFCEETSALSARFREVEVTTDGEVEPQSWPETWLRVQRGRGLVRFTDSAWMEEGAVERIRALVPGAQDVTWRGLDLRGILLAVAAGRQDLEQ